MKKYFILLSLIIAFASCTTEKKVEKKDQKIEVKEEKTFDVTKYKSIFEAIQNDDLNGVKYFIEKQNINPNAIKNETYKQNVLMIAAKKGNYDIMAYLIEKGADIKYKDNSGKTALMHAITSQKINVLDLLVEKGLNVQDIDNKENTTLIYAVKTKNAEIINYFINKKVDINKGNTLKETPLFFSVALGDLPNIELLIKKGAKFKIVNGKNQNLLFYASTKDVANYLYTKGININQEDSFKRTPIFGVIEKGFTEVVSFYCQKGINIEHRDLEENTPLLYAVKNKQGHIIEVLVNNKAKVTIVDYKGQGLIHHSPNLDVMKYLAETGADVNQQDLSGKDKIMYLAEANKLNMDVLKFFVSKGYNLNAMDNNEKVVLMYLIETNNIDFVRLFIELKADLDVKDASGLSLLDYAKDKKDMLKFLKKHIKVETYKMGEE